MRVHRNVLPLHRGTKRASRVQDVGFLMLFSDVEGLSGSPTNCSAVPFDEGGPLTAASFSMILSHREPHATCVHHSILPMPRGASPSSCVQVVGSLLPVIDRVSRLPNPRAADAAIVSLRRRLLVSSTLRDCASYSSCAIIRRSIPLQCHIGLDTPLPCSTS